jgi:hypothetical protein
MSEITVETLRGWSGAQMRAALGGPDRQKVLDVIQKLNMEQAAQIQEQQIKNDIAEITGEVDNADQLAVEAAKAAEAAQVEAARKAEESRPKKFVLDYQVTDDDGNPIGRPTHLEATSLEELSAKQKEAHVQATRAFHRLKNQKATFKPTQQPTAEQDADLLKAMEDLKSEKSETVVDAHRRIASIEVRRAQAEQDKNSAEIRRQQEVSQVFLKRHIKDFNNCQANINLVADYFKEHQLEWTLDNLEITFAAIEHKLAPVAEPAVESNAQPTPTITEQPTPQPVATVTAQPTTQTNTVVDQPRPGVNGGIIPGQNSGTRPNGGLPVTPKIDWAAEIRSWDGPTMRRKMQDPKVRPHVDQYFKNRAAAKAS